jgi:hypothetical protein
MESIDTLHGYDYILVKHESVQIEGRQAVRLQGQIRLRLPSHAEISRGTITNI